MGLLRLLALGVCIGCLLRLISSQDAPVITPSLAVLFPGSEVIFSCVNATSVVAWSINGNILLNFPPGVSVANGTALRVTISANATTYGCVDVIGPGNIIPSNNATLVLPATPAMVGNIMIDINTVNIDTNNVSFTLNWDKPFDNFDPIVNYTITINCTDASCPVMFTVTTTSASVSFITDLSMMTNLSATASNTIGTSDPTTTRIAVPGDIGMVDLTCAAVDLINQCTATWNELVYDPSVVAAPISYNVSYSLENITGSFIVNATMATIDLPAVDSDVNVVVTAMNVFGSGPASNIAADKIYAINCSVTVVRGSIKHNKGRKRTRLRFSSDGDPKVTYACKLDDEKFNDCKSPMIWQRLKKGRHTITVRAFCTDDEGNRSTTTRKKFKFQVP